MRGRTLIGLILIVLGAGFFLDAFGLLDFNGLLFTYWPSVLILLGAAEVTTRNYAGGGVLILLGGFLQADELGLLPTSAFRLLWPVLLVAGGLWLVLGRRGRAPARSASGLGQVVLFSTLEAEPTDLLRDTDLTCVFGSADVDLRKARLPDGGAVLDVTALFGSAEIRVPEAWAVEMTGTPVLGSVENRASGGAGGDGAPKLRVRATAVFGSVEVRN